MCSRGCSNSGYPWWELQSSQQLRTDARNLHHSTPLSLCVTLVGHSEQGSTNRSQRGPQLGRGILTMMTLNRSRFPPLFALGSLLFLKSVCAFSPVSGFSHQEGLRRCSGFQVTAKLTLRLNFPRELEACLTFNYLPLLHHLAYGEDSRRFRLAAFLPTNRLPLH